jgi:prepilin-type N-terminal cleavage/methylation domain-containing protein
MRTAKGTTRKGFTVLEVLVAITIFSIVSLVIFTVFGTAIRSRDIGQREIRMIEDARFAMDTIERDITNIFFRDETAYNVAISRLIEEMEMDRLRAEADGNWDSFFQRWGNPDEDRREQNPEIGDPYKRGRVIDLQMMASNGSKTDDITFAILDSLTVGKPYRAWGLSRVSYSVDSGILLRKSETVETERRNTLGESLGRPDIPRVAKVAERVEEFKLSFAFWYDGTWYEAEDWDSTRRQTRNPRFILGSYENEWLGRTADLRDSVRDNPGELLPGDDGWNEYINDLRSEPLDRLPAYIRVRLTLHGKDNEARKETFERILRVPAAEETYVPIEMLDERGVESERELRDQRYRRIFPGMAGDY